MISLATTALVDHASCIVEGRVANVSSRWTEDRSAIVTEVVIDATDVLLGETNRVSFFYKGGVVGDLEMQVSDTPKVTAGQQVLVFLRRLAPEEAGLGATDAHGLLYTLVGKAQGYYRIEGGRAIKDGFDVVGESNAIDSNLEIAVLKARIQERLAVLRNERGGK